MRNSGVEGVRKGIAMRIDFASPLGSRDVREILGSAAYRIGVRKHVPD